MQISSVLKVELKLGGGGGGSVSRTSIRSADLKSVTKQVAHRDKKVPCAYVKAVCWCCHPVRHMLQQGLILHTVHEQGAAG